MKRLWTIIGADDVPRSFNWYPALLGQTPGSPHTTILDKSSIATELSCSAFTNGERMNIPH